MSVAAGGWDFAHPVREFRGGEFDKGIKFFLDAGKLFVYRLSGAGDLAFDGTGPAVNELSGLPAFEVDCILDHAVGNAAVKKPHQKEQRRQKKGYARRPPDSRFRTCFHGLILYQNFAVNEHRVSAPSRRSSRTTAKFHPSGEKPNRD